MFVDGYFSFSFPELVGTIVTIVGIWFVVQQLREAKLASQMDGLLTLGNQFTELYDNRTVLRKLTLSEDWHSLSPKAAYARIFDDPEMESAYIEMGNHYDLVGTLVSSNALSFSMAGKMYKSVIPPIFRLLEKVIQTDRIEIDDPYLYEQWEWLAKEFEKISN